jgi:hypothetical protein
VFEIGVGKVTTSEENVVVDVPVWRPPGPLDFEKGSSASYSTFPEFGPLQLGKGITQFIELFREHRRLVGNCEGQEAYTLPWQSGEQIAGNRACPVVGTREAYAIVTIYAA